MAVCLRSLQAFIQEEMLMGATALKGGKFRKLHKMREADFYDDKAAEESSMESSIEGESWLES